MERLTEYLDRETLDRLALMFSAAAGAAVRIASADGQVIAGPTGAVESPAAAEVVVAGEHVATISLAGGADEAGAVRLLGLMRDVLAQLCGQSALLRRRVEELAAMYRLTDDFTGRTDLDEVHRLAAETMVKVTGADAASIRVLNEDRTELLQEAACGLSEEYVAKGPIKLADSRIDREVFQTGRSVYVADERTDDRVLYKAEARREGIVSALCAPMSYRGGIEGVIHVYTRAPHEFDWFERSLILGVASQAAWAIVNARLYAAALTAERMRRQLRLAGDVQRRMIPVELPKVAGLDIAAVYVPCFEVGGDFYDFLALPGGRLGVCVADVVGKGIRASLLMASVRAALHAHAMHLPGIAGVLRAVNREMCRQSETSDFLTLFYGELDPAARTLTYCSAGHEPALLIRGGRVRQLTGGGGVIGMDPDMRFRRSRLELVGGDVLVMCTDGLPEAMNFDDEPFGRRRVRQAARAACARGESAEGVAKHLLWEMRRFAGLQKRFDDLTLVTIRVQ